MKLLGLALVCIVLAAASGAAAAETLPADAAFLSFAELYRLTVGAPAAPAPHEAREGLLPVSVETPAPPVFAVSGPAPRPAPAFSFSVAGLALPEPSSRWLLLASGLALAAWVARRRLGYPF